MSDSVEEDLPQGWRIVELGNVVRVVNGTTPQSSTSNYWGGDIVWITPTDLGKLKEREIVSSERKITQAGFDSCGLSLVPSGTVILSSRAPIGHLGIAKTELCINQGCKALIPKADVDSDFLYFAMKKSVSALQALGSGSTFAEVSKTQVEKFELPLPPLAEQKRIAAILTEQLVSVEKARKASEARLEAARALPIAYLREVFESKEAKGWQTVRLEDVSHIASGITLGRKLSDSRSVQKIPYLRVANVKDGFLDLSNITSIEATENEIEKLQLQYGDLLLTEGGDPDKLGRGTVWQKEIDECIHQNHIFRVRFVTDDVNPFFASFQMQAKYGKEYFLRHAKQTTGIATINQQVLRAFPLLLPPLDIQKILVKQLGNCLKQANLANSLIQEELSYISNVAPALLRQAFSGTL